MGNDKADRLAKHAVGKRPGSFRDGTQKPVTTQVAIQRLLSVSKRFVREHSIDQWQQDWTTALHGGHLRGQHEETVELATLDKYKDVASWQASIIAQLRIGKIGFRDHLFRINAADSSACLLCQAERQTIHHVLFVCPALDRLRGRVLFPPPLGRYSTSLRAVLADNAACLRAANFLINSNLLHQFKWEGERMTPNLPAPGEDDAPGE